MKEALSPICLSIGNFDGVHLGHCAVVKQLLERTKSVKGQSAIFTFTNHPKEVLTPQTPLYRLCSLQQKVEFLKSLGVENIISVPFTEEFADQTAEEFLSSLREKVPFTHLVLGYDTTFGRSRSGTPDVICELGEKMNFSVEYIEPLEVDGSPVSSTRIRRALKEGMLEEVELLLGRPYQLDGIVEHGEGRGREMSFPTLNLDVTDYALPPFGVYECEAEVDGIHYRGLINLGVAPTVRNSNIPVLEVHLLRLDDKRVNFYGKRAIVIFKQFLRPEMKFNSVEELKRQIAEDVKRVS